MSGGCPTDAVLRVGLCQVWTEEWAVEDNTRRALSAVEEAARQGAQLAVTPECVFHGYGFGGDDYATAMARIAEPAGGERVGRFRTLARGVRNRRALAVLRAVGEDPTPSG